LAEDNRVNQKIIVGLLNKSGIKIDIAENGQQAIKMFDATIHDLILMDIQMPLMDGYQAASQIRSTNDSTPIIALTANALVSDMERSRAAGMNEHLNKPIEVNKLYKTLLRYLPKKNNV
ncbi:MAG: response regulator, partial [Calditrichia bacterium]